MQYNRAISSATGRVANDPVSTPAARCAAYLQSLYIRFGPETGGGAMIVITSIAEGKGIRMDRLQRDQGCRPFLHPAPERPN
jgi:hypothetical protein